MTIKILSYNIQAAIGTQAYRQYITQINRQLFNTKHKSTTLRAIAEFTEGYDVACLQEVDLGGRRAGFECQVDQLHRLSHFEYMSIQENRIVRNISRHGNAILSKEPQSDIQDLKLPGKRPGRGAILSRIDGAQPFHVINVHLSLGVIDQMTQIEFLIERAPKNVPLIIAGDFNCSSRSLPLQRLAEGLHLKVLTSPGDKTYPSWNPKRGYDHVLVSEHFDFAAAEALDVRLSDHRPVKAALSIKKDRLFRGGQF